MGNQASVPAPPDAPHVVIVGGGYAGMTVALQLQDAGGLRVTLVDPKGEFHHLLGATRAMAKDGFERLISIPRDRALPRVERVAGVATRVDAASRTLHWEPPAGGAAGGAGGALRFDILVVATGMAYTSPGYSPVASGAATQRAYADVRAAIRAASSVCVVGGGTVGVEVAGEVAAGYPGKAVTLVHSGARLINGRDNGAAAEEPAIGEAALTRLQALGVRVVLNDRLPKPAPGGGLTPVAPHVWAGGGATPVRTDKGAEVAADLQLWTAGGGGANTGFLAGVPGATAAGTGEVVVDAHFRSPAHPWLFAAGDAAGSGHPKMALVIERATAPVVAANVLAAARAAGKTGGDVGAVAPTALKTAPAWSHVAMIVVLSPRVGFGKLGPLWLPDAIVSAAKGGDKLVGRYLKKLSYTSAELQA